MFFHNDLRYIVWKRNTVARRANAKTVNVDQEKTLVVMTEERIAIILLTH
jgi:hypothetical protein